jgi:hypothetical protein
MLSLEVLQDGKTIQIYCDQKGMSSLLEKLAHLVRDAGHTHMRGPSAGGIDLDETTPFGETAVREVVIDYNPDYELPAAK